MPKFLKDLEGFVWLVFMSRYLILVQQKTNQIYNGWKTSKKLQVFYCQSNNKKTTKTQMGSRELAFRAESTLFDDNFDEEFGYIACVVPVQHEKIRQ